MDAGSLYGPAAIVKGILHLLHHEMRHVTVNVAGELDEAGFNAGLPCLPGKIEGINWDAVPTQAGPRIKRHISEGLGCRSVNHFPDVDSHAVTHYRQLVH